MRRIIALSLSTSALALMCCGAAHAQTTSTDSSTNANNGGVEEVVVTAERRTENLQKTAISATVLGGQDLANKNVITVDQLQFIAPSVAVDNFGQGNDFNIRGIGKGEHNSQTGTGVITYRDGVPTFPGYITEEPYYDISSIEILRGPQGTFVGSNATGGAVFVNTNDPVIGGGYDGYIMAGLGNYNDRSVQGAVNIPVSDTLAIRVALFTDERDSFYHITDSNLADACPHNKYDGCKPGYNPGNVRWAAGRFSLLWKPTSALTVSFKTDIDYLNSGAYPADPAAVASTVGPYYSKPNPGDPFHITANAPQLALDRFIRSSLKVDYVFDNGITLRSISAYQRGNTRYRADLDGTDAGLDTFYDATDETIWSEEVNLISPDTGRFTWVVGGFAQKNTYDFLPPYQFDIDLYSPAYYPAYNYQLQGTNPQRSIAVFGQASFKVTDDLKFEFGGRYTNSNTKNNVDVQQYGVLFSDTQSASFNNFSYKAALDWSVDDNNFIYGFIATGYKPGGLNVPVAAASNLPDFKGERVTSYEAGWKSTMLDGHLQTDIDGYYNAYNGFQVTIGYPQNPAFGFEVNDPNTTKIYGVEAQVQAVFGALSFDFGAGLMHSSLGQFYAVDSRFTQVDACNPKSGPAEAPPVGYCQNVGGNPQTYAPNFTFNVGAQYAFDLGNENTLTPRVNYGHVSDQWASVFDNAAMGDRLGERNILGAQLAWNSGTWTATLYGSNLTNEHYIAAVNSGIRWAGLPRQFGINVVKTF